MILESKLLTTILLILSIFALGFAGIKIFARTNPNTVKLILRGTTIGGMLLCVLGILMLI